MTVIICFFCQFTHENTFFSIKKKRDANPLYPPPGFATDSTYTSFYIEIHVLHKSSFYNGGI